MILSVISNSIMLTIPLFTFSYNHEEKKNGSALLLLFVFIHLYRKIEETDICNYDWQDKEQL